MLHPRIYSIIHVHGKSVANFKILPANDQGTQISLTEKLYMPFMLCVVTISADSEVCLIVLRADIANLKIIFIFACYIYIWLQHCMP